MITQSRNLNKPLTLIILAGLASSASSWASGVKCVEFMAKDASQAITFSGAIESADPARIVAGLNFTNLYAEQALKSEQTDQASNYVENFADDNGTLVIASYRKSQTQIVASTFFISKKIGATAAFLKNFTINPYNDARSGNPSGVSPSDSIRVINQKLRNNFFADRYNHNGIDFNCVVW